MNELEKSDQQNCQLIGQNQDGDRIALCELVIERREGQYTIKVASRSYLAELRAHNAAFAPELQLDDNCLPYDGQMEEAPICAYLASIPFQELNPYLTRQALLDD